MSRPHELWVSACGTPTLAEGATRQIATALTDERHVHRICSQYRSAPARIRDHRGMGASLGGSEVSWISCDRIEFSGPRDMDAWEPGDSEATRAADFLVSDMTLTEHLFPPKEKGTREASSCFVTSRARNPASPNALAKMPQTCDLL